MSDDRKAALRAELEAAHGRLQATASRLTDADWEQPASKNAAWRRRDILAHLSSIQERQRRQVACAFGREPWPAEAIDDYNARRVAERRGWSVQQLRDELDREVAASLRLLDGLSPEELRTEFEHPTRGKQTVDETLLRIATHIDAHAAEL